MLSKSILTIAFAALTITSFCQDRKCNPSDDNESSGVGILFEVLEVLADAATDELVEEYANKKDTVKRYNGQLFMGLVHNFFYQIPSEQIFPIGLNMGAAFKLDEIGKWSFGGDLGLHRYGRFDREVEAGKYDHIITTFNVRTVNMILRWAILRNELFNLSVGAGTGLIWFTTKTFLTDQEVCECETQLDRKILNQFSSVNQNTGVDLQLEFVPNLLKVNDYWFFKVGYQKVGLAEFVPKNAFDKLPMNDQYHPRIDFMDHLQFSLGLISYF